MALPTVDKKPIDKYYIGKCMKNNYGLEFWLKAGGVFSIGKNGRFIYLISGLYVIAFFMVFPLLVITAYKAAEVKNRVLAKIFTIMGKGFYDYENTLDEECLSVAAKTLNESKRRKKIIAKVFIVVVMCACLSITILRPIMKFLLGEHLLGKPDDGILRLIPVNMWTPFNKDSWYAMVIFYLSQDVIGYVTPGLVFGCTLFVVFACEDVGSQLIILGQSLKSVIRRAERLDMPTDEALKLCFSHSIRHHQTILMCVKTLEKLLYIPGLGLLFGSTILMCICGFIFVSKEVPFPSKFVFGMFLLSELMLIFLVCWCGENIQKTSTLIFDMVYSSEWPDNMSSMKNYVLIIQLRTIEPIKISFGGLMDASFETYSNICSSAFSYFNILIAVN
ncbi:odorant receptor 4-like isoform X2 [Halyomorpha halys]|uniref:odorant receptor 4-like isoform X2 n=1 Tax=Halyomorpha halys TaxID=286706 RepID=UPI0034D22620